MAELNIVDTGPGGVEGQILTPYLQNLQPGYNYGTSNGYMEFGSGTPGSLPFRVDQAGNVTAESINATLLGGLQPSGDMSGAKDTAAIQALVNLGSVTIQLAPGNFYVTAASGFALTWQSHVNMYGAGVSITTLNVVGTNIGGITGTDLSHVNFRDFQIVGTSGTSGDGTGNQGIWIQKNTGPSAYMEFTNVLVKNFNGIGFEADDIIVSTFRELRSVTNALHGIYINVGTSLTFDSCYANTDSKGIGYWLKQVSYSALNGCACDAPALGYLFDGCTGVAAVACGTERPLAAGSFDGSGFKVSGGSNVSLIACRNLTNNAIAYYVTGSATQVVIINPLEQTPGGSATASIQTDSGTQVVVISPKVTTATAYTTGTVNQIAYNAMGIGAAAGTTYMVDLTGTANAQIRMTRPDNTTHSAAVVFDENGVDEWLVGMRADSTNDLHIRDINHGLDAIQVQERATQLNLGFLGAGSFGGGVGVMFIANDTTDPTTNPTGGGILYVSGGALKYRGSSGTVTVLGAA